MDKKQTQFWQRFRGKNKYLLSGLLAFSLTLFVWAAPAQQTPTPQSTLSPKEEVVAKIKGAAERHVKADSSMQTSTVLKLFESNTVGLTAPEIAQIYEEEYSRLKEEIEADPWEQIVPKVGWIAAGILGIFFIFKEALKKWFEKLFEVLGAAIYNRFAGSKLFQGLALRRYQKALIEKHRELKITFRPNKHLQMQEVYVPLKVVDGSHKKEEIDAYRAIAESRRLMVKGAPGAGKSMLLKHIALSYAERGFATAGNSVPILLELHRLIDQEKSISQYLVEALARDEFPKAERFVEQGLKNGTFLLLFDGLDEVNSAERQQVVRQINDLIDECSKCRVVITCRTQVYRDEFSGTVDHTLEVVEFTDQQIQSFLQPWQSSMPPDKSPEQLLQNLHDRPRIMTLARNPLMLTIIAYLYTDTPFVLPHSRSEFYQKSTDVLLDQWHQEHNQFPARDKKSVLRHLALYNQDSVDHQQQDRRSVDYLTVIAEVKRVLPSLNIDEEKAEPFLKEIVERSGLLLEIDGGERYQFAHLTLQEYFAAAKLIEDEPVLLARFEKDPDGWREVVKLWCGLAEDSTKIIEGIFVIDRNTAFECLADAQKMDQGIADKIIDDFKVNLAAIGQEDVIAAAFGAVAADIRPRGKAVFKFLAETLARDPEPSRRMVAAKALSMTNLPEAAKVLAERYKVNHAEVAQPLVRMGDLAVDQLRYLAESSYLQAPDEFHLRALDELYRIGTPKSANFLVRFLWHKEPKIANRVAGHLASLLMLPNIEDSLHETDQAPTPSRILNISTPATWIWEPFTEVTNPKLPLMPLIVSQIACCLEDSSETDFLQPVLNFDPRIVIPLCSVQMADKVNLPKKLSHEAEVLLAQTTIEVLLAQTTIDDELNEKIIKLINESLGTKKPYSHWEFLLFRLEPQLQLKLLHQLINNRLPQRSDWLRIFKPVNYDFSKSWSYGFILACVCIALLAGLFNMFYAVYAYSYANGATSTIVWILSSIIVWTLLGGLVIMLILPFFNEVNHTVVALLGIAFIAFLAFLLLAYFPTTALLRFLPWQNVALIWIALITTCTALWVRGQRLDSQARNPLQGLIPNPKESLGISLKKTKK